MGERRVKADLIRPLGGKKKKKRPDDSEAEDGEYEEGDKIEARFGGRSRWFKGKIDKKNRDGTYDIRYEDGDKERRVKAELIRPLGGKKKKKRPDDSEDEGGDGEYEEGDKI